MSILDATLSDFGRTLGMTQLSFDSKQRVHLKLETIGDLFFEAVSSTVVIYLVRTIHYPSVKVFKKALEISYWEDQNAISLTPGLQGDNTLAFITHVPQESFTLPTIELSIKKLQEAHNRIANNQK